ncbi:hypothetical protein [Jeongeupia naejangsanensis]|uniref:Uncharacterized protein n=1 Tax=Jeongeupia naejangsanensis TaxID=613195 RepID=A0ABS2BH84_9NEIS|nr:hypothetical protein [Jeongeupia naejangsanensis]MBM3114969.1 hypothetical protein [Jeongeupia naejangsanensis]
MLSQAALQPPFESINFDMDAVANIKRAINLTFGDEQPEVAGACVAIVNFLTEQLNGRRLHLTMSLLMDVVKPGSEESLFIALNYLSGARFNLLEMCFEFVDENDEYHPLTKSEISEARKTKQLLHPVSGEIVRDFESSVLVYFSTTQRADSILLKGVE